MNGRTRIPLAGMNCVVTGGAGFIGSHLVDALLHEGARTVVLDDLSGCAAGNLERVRSRISFHQADVRDARLMSDLLEGADFVFHLAANASVPMSVEDPAHDFEVNALGTQRVLIAARDRGVRRVILCSSAAVYGIPSSIPIREDHVIHPVSPYGASKAAAEALGDAYRSVYGLDVVTCRLFNIYGPRQRRYVMHDLFIKLTRRGELSVRGDGRQIRDYCYVTDAAKAILLVAQTGEGVYNIARGAGISIREVAESMVRMIAPETTIHYGEATWKGDIPVLHADTARLQALGFEPKVDLEAGLSALIEEHRNSL